LTTGAKLDMIWIMAKIQTNSTASPLENRVLALAIEFILKADSMGVLTSPVDTLNLDIEAIIRAAKDVGDLGIGRRVVINPELWRTYNADDLCSKLKMLSSILEESPQPKTEWKRLRTLLSDELLAKMTHVSEQSVRRYAAEERETPDDVASRLHWLALITGDLQGAYNAAGVRNWFLRPRNSFGGKTPIEMLGTEPWNTTDKKPVLVRAFAHSLLEGMGT
jgi:uncharacterized protein (DUF2384 family)